MKHPIALIVSTLLLMTGCDDHFRTLWHDQRLPSGKTIKVTSFLLAWGIEHKERDTGKDCFVLEYVSSDPKADPKQREAEAVEVFELVRPISEQWGFQSAEILGFPTLQRKGRYDIYGFKRQPDGRWLSTHTERKVFSND